MAYCFPLISEPVKCFSGFFPLGGIGYGFGLFHKVYFQIKIYEQVFFFLLVVLAFTVVKNLACCLYPVPQFIISVFIYVSCLLPLFSNIAQRQGGFFPVIVLSK